MVTIRKMKKQDVPQLYNMAIRAFQPDYDRYGVYPPLLKTKNMRFMPPLVFGHVVHLDSEIIGGAFIVGIGKKGEVGAIFLDPAYQGKGYGKELMAAIENMYPKVRSWKLDTPAESYGIHRFYESLGYIKTGEIKDPKSEMTGFKYEKKM